MRAGRYEVNNIANETHPMVHDYSTKDTAYFKCTICSAKYMIDMTSNGTPKPIKILDPEYPYVGHTGYTGGLELTMGGPVEGPVDQG